MTAPTTEQVREARERLERDLANGGYFGDTIAADIRTILDALDDLQGRKDRQAHTLNSIADLKAKHAAPSAPAEPEGGRLLVEAWEQTKQVPASPVPSVTDEDVERAYDVQDEARARPSAVPILRRVLEDFASRKGAEK